MQIYQSISMCSLQMMSLFTASRRHCALQTDVTVYDNLTSLLTSKLTPCSPQDDVSVYCEVTSLFTDDVIALAPEAELMSVVICPDSDRHKL